MEPLTPTALANAFAAFSHAAATLEGSYRELQAEVGALNGELAVRNRELESSLRENEQIRAALAALVESMPCGVLVLDRNGAVERMNPEACRLLRVAPGLPVRDLAELAAVSGVPLLPFAGMVGEGELCVAPGAGGEERWIAVRTWLAAERSDGGAPSTILILRDITAEKHAEGERESGRRAFALAEVAAILAHEMRNPLASMELFLDLLEADLPAAGEFTCDLPALGARTTAKGNAATWLGHLRAGLRVMANTVGNALSQRAAEAAPQRRLALCPTVAAAAEFVRPVVAQAGMRLRLQFAPGAEEPMVMASEPALGQLLLNLVLNAVRHTPPKGEIAIEVGRIADRAVLSVADTGCGIAPAHLERIFEAGWSGSGATSGLGLAVCQRIAAQHRGVLRVASEPCRGSRFTLELPCVL